MNPSFPVVLLLLASTAGVSAQLKTDANVLVPAQQNATNGVQTAGTCVVDGMQNATLVAAIACTGDHGVVRIPMFAVPELTANISVPAGVVLRFEGPSPGIIRLGNFDLTINGPLDAPRAQIFSYTGTGTVSFGRTASGTLYPEWFGAKGDGLTDDRVALQNTWNASVIGVSPHDSTHGEAALPISFGCKVYLVASSPGLNFTNTDDFHVSGCNQFTTRIQINFTGSNTVGVDISADFSGIFRDMAIICGTSASNAPTVCLLHARSNSGNSSNGILEQFQNVSVQGFSPWIYYNYRAEQASWIDSQISENAATGTPLTISAVNSAGVISPNAHFGGDPSCTLYTFKGATMTVSSSATTANSKLLYLDEGSSSAMIQSVWYEGFYNMQGRHQAFVADTDGATGRIDDLVLLAHGNSLSGSNVITKINGTAYHWHIEGQHDPPDANGDTAFQFANLSNSFVRFVTNAKNCFTAPDASHSIISVDRSCTPFAPNALLVSAASTSIPSLATLTFSHAGSTTLSPQSASGAFTVTVPAATGQFAVTPNPAVSTVAPTISWGFGTSPRIALQNGTAAFEIVVGSNPATTGVIALPAATNGWACKAEDMSNLGVTTRETAFTSTSVTFSAAPSWGAGDQLLVTCTAF